MTTNNFRGFQLYNGNNDLVSTVFWEQRPRSQKISVKNSDGVQIEVRRNQRKPDMVGYHWLNRVLYQEEVKYLVTCMVFFKPSEHFSPQERTHMLSVTQIKKRVQEAGEDREFTIVRTADEDSLWWEFTIWANGNRGLLRVSVAQLEGIPDFVSTRVKRTVARCYQMPKGKESTPDAEPEQE